MSNEKFSKTKHRFVTRWQLSGICTWDMSLVRITSVSRSYNYCQFWRRIKRPTVAFRGMKHIIVKVRRVSSRRRAPQQLFDLSPQRTERWNFSRQTNQSAKRPKPFCVQKDTVIENVLIYSIINCDVYIMIYVCTCVWVCVPIICQYQKRSVDEIRRYTLINS